MLKRSLATRSAVMDYLTARGEDGTSILGTAITTLIRMATGIVMEGEEWVYDPNVHRKVKTKYYYMRAPNMSALNKLLKLAGLSPEEFQGIMTLMAKSRVADAQVGVFAAQVGYINEQKHRTITETAMQQEARVPVEMVQTLVINVMNGVLAAVRSIPQAQWEENARDDELWRMHWERIGELALRAVDEAMNRLDPDNPQGSMEDE